MNLLLTLRSVRGVLNQNYAEFDELSYRVFCLLSLFCVNELRLGHFEVCQEEALWASGDYPY